MMPFLFPPAGPGVTGLTFPELLCLVPPLLHLVLVDQPVKSAVTGENRQQGTCGGGGVGCSPTQSTVHLSILREAYLDWVGAVS